MSTPIITPQEMRAAEKAVIDAGTSGFELMLRAGREVAEFVHSNFPNGRIQVLCGPGGNGGDGFVAAAVLKEYWRDVEVYCAVELDSLSGDAAKAAGLWKGEVAPLESTIEAPFDVAVDGLFGAGLSRPLEGAAAALAKRGGLVVSIDMPSGVDGTTGEPTGPCFRAAATVTFAALKPAHVLQPGASFCGQVIAADIGVPIASTIVHNHPMVWGRQMPQPADDVHKHQRGHVKVVSGGVSQTGAARLAAKAALRIGAGLVTVVSPPDALLVNAAHLTAVMLEKLDQAKPSFESATAAVIGPAAGVNEDTKQRVLEALATDCKVVLDADALSVFEANPSELFERLRVSDVLTPHFGEFKRLFGNLAEQGLNKIELARQASLQAGCIVLLKGPDTVIAAPDGRVVVSNHSIRWLATAGSGDVLAGFIAGLMGQGMESLVAAGMAAWVHGEAARRVGAGLISEDLEKMVPDILSALHGELG